MLLILRLVDIFLNECVCKWLWVQTLGWHSSHQYNLYDPHDSPGVSGSLDNPSFHFISLQFQDIADEQISRALETKNLDAPRIMLFKRNTKLTGAFIVGDIVTLNVNVRGESWQQSLNCFDLHYSRIYSMVLGIIQTFVMGEPYRLHSSKGLKVLTKQIETAFKDVPCRDENSDIHN